MRAERLLIVALLSGCIPDARLVPDPPAPVPNVPRCGGRPCPVHVASELAFQSNPIALAVGDGVTYLCDGGEHPYVWRISDTPGVEPEIIEETVGCSGIAYADGTIYWSNDASVPEDQPVGVRSAPADAFDAAVLLGDNVAAKDVKVVGGAVLVSGSLSLFRLVPGANDWVKVPGHVGNQLSGVIAIGPDGRVFVAWPGEWNITMSLDADGTGGRVIVDDQPPRDAPPAPLALAADESFVYFGMHDELRRARVDGNGDWEVIATSQGDVTGIVLAGDWVYYLAGGDLRRVAKGGGEVATVVSNREKPRGLVGTKRWLTWGEDSSPAAVVRIAWPEE